MRRVEGVLQEKPDHVRAIDIEAGVTKARHALLDTFHETTRKSKGELFRCCSLRHEEPL